MGMSVSITSAPSKGPVAFLNAAAGNYLSSRILFLRGQFHDAGYLAHEAIEKVMKALLYLRLPGSDYDDKHDLNFLRNQINHKLQIDLKDFKEPFKYYEECYKYRYPDTSKAPSFSTGTRYIQLLDDIFFFFHELCMQEIQDDKVRNRSGILFSCESYFVIEDLQDIIDIVNGNDKFTQVYIDTAKKYWHDKGQFVEKDGVTRTPEAVVVKRQ